MGGLCQRQWRRDARASRGVHRPRIGGGQANMNRTRAAASDGGVRRALNALRHRGAGLR
jgi:hypothetical protein